MSGDTNILAPEAIDSAIYTTSALYTTTQYWVRVSNECGQLSSRTATVALPSKPLINSFTASPTLINQGQSSVLSWNITGASSASINQGIGTINPASGNRTVSPTSTTIYVLTATNGAGSSTAETTVTVQGGGSTPGSLYATDSIAGKLRYVPATGAGGYLQGKSQDDPCNQYGTNPFTHVLTKNLAVMETEVTQGMWAALQAADAGFTPTNPSYYTGDNRPVEQVTWYEAILFANRLSVLKGLTPCYYTNASFTIPVTSANYTSGPFYCNWDANGYRLPSEGEWEYYCRAGTTTPFYAAETNFTSCTSGCTTGTLPGLESVAWFCANNNKNGNPDGSKAVGQKNANPWGLKDIHGNVFEWCWDWYAAPYPASTMTDYRGTVSGSFRIFRGGGWAQDANYLRSAARAANTPDYRDSVVGFRLVRSID